MRIRDARRIILPAKSLELRKLLEGMWYKNKVWFNFTKEVRYKNEGTRKLCERNSNTNYTGKVKKPK